MRAPTHRNKRDVATKAVIMNIPDTIIDSHITVTISLEWELLLNYKHKRWIVLIKNVLI